MEWREDADGEGRLPTAIPGGVGVGAAFDGLPVDDERLDATGDEADLFVVVPVFGDTCPWPDP